MTIKVGCDVVGTGEVSLDEDTEVRAAGAALARVEYEVTLPAGSGTWVIDIAPRAMVKALAAELPSLIGQLRAAGLDHLDLAEVGDSPATAAGTDGLPSESVAEHPMLRAGRLRLRSLDRVPGSRADVAHLVTSGGGSSRGDGDVVAEFAIDALGRPPHDQNVTKLLVRNGQRHAVIVLGTWTREHRWDVFHPVVGGSGFHTPPSRSPQLPAGLSDVWVIDVRTGWAAWWNPRHEWTLVEGRQDWWRDQTHLESVRRVLAQRGESE